MPSKLLAAGRQGIVSWCDPKSGGAVTAKLVQEKASFLTAVLGHVGEGRGKRRGLYGQCWKRTFWEGAPESPDSLGRLLFALAAIPPRQRQRVQLGDLHSLMDRRLHQHYIAI